MKLETSMPGENISGNMADSKILKEKSKVHKEKRKSEGKSKKRKAEESVVEDPPHSKPKKTKPEEPFVEDQPRSKPKEKKQDNSPEKPALKEKKTKKNKAEKVNGNLEPEALKEKQALSAIEEEGAFEKFRISERTLAKLRGRGVTYLFPIQSRTFNHVFDGDDVLAQARTGSGKTFSFTVPIVELLQKNSNTMSGRLPRVLTLLPTRELARQVAEDFTSLTDGLTVLPVYGGTPYGPQVSKLRAGVDVLVGTPGRIIDLLEKGSLSLDNLQHVVLDEVDRMLDMGFAENVDQILNKSYNHENKADNPQTLLFSATMPFWVHSTAQKYMKESRKMVDLVGSDTVKTSTTVRHLAIRCSYFDRASTIGAMLQVYSGNHGRAMVFCQKKRDCDELATSNCIKQETHVLHGDIPQEKREIVLKKFREGRYRCLITTDVSARGLDIPEVDLVIQCAPPQDVDSYIHRSGRTGRAGRPGTCVLFYKPQEEYELRLVEKRAGIQFKKVGAPTPDDMIKAAAEDAAKSLVGVSEQTRKCFEESAERLIEEQGAVHALAAALALISGSTEIKSRSLLSSQEGYTTYLFRTNIVMNTLSYAWRGLERLLTEDVKEKIQHMRWCADKMGCAFDLPSELDSSVDEMCSEGKYDSLQKATELPELLEDDRQSGGFGGRGNGRGRGFGGNRGRTNGFGRGHSNGFSRGGRGNGFSSRGHGNKSFNNGGGFGQGLNSKKTFD